MTTERYLDPLTRDYLLPAGRDLVRADPLLNEVFKRTAQVKGDSPLEPEVGRRKRERLKDLPETRALLLEDVRESLGEIVTAGRAQSVTVRESEAVTAEAGKIFIETEIVDGAGRPRTFTTWIAVS